MGFLKQIDWVRNTVFLLFYIIGVAVFFLLVLKPALDTFKVQNASYRKEEFMLTQIQQKYQEARQNLSEYEQSNATILGALQGSGNISGGVQKLRNSKQSMRNLKVTPEGGPFMEEGYSVQRYVVSGQISNLNSLKNAISESTRMGGITKVTFPIQITSDKNGLSVQYRIDVYTMPSKSPLG